MGEALKGSDRPLVITSGTGMGSPGPGQLATEDVLDLHHPNPRKASEMAGVAVAERGVNVIVVRLPQVHDTFKQGLITPLIEITRQKGVSGYLGDGQNRWAAAPLADVARLYKLAFEKRRAGARYHAVAEEGVTAKEIAETIGKGLNVPVRSLSPQEAGAHFGWMAMFAGMDMPASGAQTQKELDWHPTGPGLITDLKNMKYA